MAWASFREILPLHTIEELRELMMIEEGGLGGPPTPVPSGEIDGPDDGGGELEAAPPVDPAPAAAAVPGAPPVAFGGQDSDDSERGGDDDFNDNCEVPASEDAEMMGWDTYDDDYVGS